MVCAQEEQAVLCVVQDTTTRKDGDSSPPAYSVSLPIMTTARQLVHEVASHFNYDPANIKLIFTLDSGPITLTESSEETFVDWGVRPDSHNVRFQLALKRKVKRLPIFDPVNTQRKDAIADSDQAVSNADAIKVHATNNQNYPYTASLIKQDTGYVGLVNQAMTCYLNSLLQALFMTPEFRNALYKWKYDNTVNTDPAKCIPYQLQRLFLNLQTSQRTAVETTELTKSFGWDSSEAWHQHDIQELCRVMFDALEHVFKGTNQADLIDRLYQGTMIDYVKCLECGKEKFREDTFLDIPLPVRPFGSTIAYGSVVEALRAFVQPETLEGTNQYFCESCAKKCDAHKGLKFSKFPYLLTLHLKRFDFDYNTMHRVKLNDKVTFPENLDLNGFVEQHKEKEEGSDGIPDSELTAIKYDDSSTTDSGSALDDEGCQGVTDLPALQDLNQEDDEGIDVSSSSHHENEKNKCDELSEGPYHYKLFSIMIHSGSASGGHYYAYIKDFTNGKWFCFNDTSVSRITNEDIRKTFGGGALRGYYSGAYSSSTNAYMLMYRQITDNNCDAMKIEDFPPHIKDLCNELEERRETDHRIRAKYSDTTKVKVFCHHPSYTHIADVKLYLDSESTLKDATMQAYIWLKLDDLVDLADCRLVSYNSKQESIEMSFTGRENDLFTDIMKSATFEDLLLEIKPKYKEFEHYQPGGITIKVLVVDLEKEEVELPPISVRTSLNSTVGDLKATISLLKNVNIDQNNIILVTEKFTNEFQILEFDSMSLQNIGFYSSNKVYVSKGSLDEPFVKSKLYRLLDTFEHVISLNVSLPDTDPDTLVRMSIPSLNSNNCTVFAKSGGDSAANYCVDKAVKLTDNKLESDLSNKALVVMLHRLVMGNGGGDDENGVTSGGGGSASGGHSDQSTSEDSSLTDSERTLIGDVPEDCWHPGDSQLVSPSEEEPACALQPSEENWDEDVPTQRRSYFKACYSADKKTLKVQVDKWMPVKDFKVYLEPYVAVPLSCFKLYHTENKEQVTSRSRVCESLTGLHNNDTLTVTLSRKLTNDELRLKVYQLELNSQQPVKFLCDWIVAKTSSVGQTKKDIVDDVNKRNGLNLQYNKCRLRRKNWKNIGKVYLDYQTWTDNVSLYSSGYIFLQELPEGEILTSPDQVCVLVRQWRPSLLTLEPFQEIILDNRSCDEFKQKLSQISGIPAENIKVAKPTGAFPYDMSILAIHSDLDWTYNASSLDSHLLQISEEGGVIFFRDDREAQQTLTKGERTDIEGKESIRLRGTHNIYSPRKEKPLKIYLDRRPCYVAEPGND